VAVRAVLVVDGRSEAEAAESATAAAAAVGGGGKCLDADGPAAAGNINHHRGPFTRPGSFTAPSGGRRQATMFRELTQRGRRRPTACLSLCLADSAPSPRRIRPSSGPPSAALV